MSLVKRERAEWPELFRRLFDVDLDTKWMRVEEYRDGDELVIRAELPDVDPDHDVEITISDGMLHIEAHREERSEHKDKGSYRSEFRYGSFSRSLPLPAGTPDDAVKAGYHDGVLEIRVPAPPEVKTEVTVVPVTRR